MMKIFLFLCFFHKGFSNHRNPLAPEQWKDRTSQPLSREELIHDLLLNPHRGEIHVEDFLWTGSGDSELPAEDFDLTSSMADIYDGKFIPHFPTTLTVTQVSTVVSTILHNLPKDQGDIRPTPTYIVERSSHAPRIDTNGSIRHLPNEKYLVRTVVLSNMTTIHNDIEGFRRAMELKLEKAFKQAYGRKMKKREKRDIFLRKRQAQSEETPPRVKIHNIRSSLPKPEIEMLYTVYEDDRPILAETAVETFLDNVDDKDAETLLGFPVITKAEPYVQTLRVPTTLATGSSNWMIAAIVLSTLFLLCLILLLLLLGWHRHNRSRDRASSKHRRLVSSPIISQPSTLKGQPPSPVLDTRPQSPSVRVSEEVDSLNCSSQIKDTASTTPPTFDDRATSTAALHMTVDRAESPILADLSSNATPEVKHKKTAPKSRARRSKNKKVGPPSATDQSAFPSRTPDRAGWLGPLSDLLEEDVEYPGEKGGDWPYHLPSSPSTSSTTSTLSSSSCSDHKESTWRHEALKAKETSVRYAQALNKVFPPPPPTPPPPQPLDNDMKVDEEEGGARAISAKSHIFRKGKIESRLSHLGKNNRTRPWSATESRLRGSDPTFHMRQRHWEGLIAGKKHLHRGQLLPGSTSSEEESTFKKPTTTCWSEGSSPRKQVRLATSVSNRGESDNDENEKPDPAGPLIQAIKDELQKFHREKSPNLAAITVINDPDLVHRESSA